MTIAEKIYKLRTDAGLSQEKFASKAGLSQSAVNYWESGKRQPRINQLKKIANAFDIPLYTLTDDNYPLWDINSELEKKRARALGDTEMVKPPGPFTVPLSQNHTKDNDIYIDSDLQNLYEAAIQKAKHHEELTDFEQQVIIGIPEQLRQKNNSYEDSYSFASSEYELNKCFEQQQGQDKETSKKLLQFADSDNNTHKYDASIRVNLTSEKIEYLKEINRIYKKIENKENLTKDELQILKDDNERQRTAMKRLQETLRTMQEKLIPAYAKLNKTGQEEAAKRIEELTEISRYTKSDEPPQE